MRGNRLGGEKRPTNMRGALVLAISLLGSCASSSGGNANPQGAVSLTAREMRVWVQPPSESLEGLMANVAGTLQYDSRHDCLLLGPDNGVQYPVVWPAGTRPSPEGGVLLPDGQHVQIGDEVSGGGGYFEPPPAFDIPTECLPNSHEVAVYNPNSDVMVNATTSSRG